MAITFQISHSPEPAYEGDIISITVLARWSSPDDIYALGAVPPGLAYRLWLDVTDPYGGHGNHRDLTQSEINSGSVNASFTTGPYNLAGTVVLKCGIAVYPWPAPGPGSMASDSFSIGIRPPPVHYGVLRIPVVDKKGYLVLGADVRIQDTSGSGTDKTYNTGDTGTVWTDPIPLGYYKITATKDGFTGYAEHFLQRTVDEPPGYESAKVQIPGYNSSGPTPKPDDPVVPDPPPTTPQPSSLYGYFGGITGEVIVGATVRAVGIGGGASGSYSTKTVEMGYFELNLPIGIWELSYTDGKGEYGNTAWVSQIRDLPVYDQRYSGATNAGVYTYLSSERQSNRFGQVAGFVKTSDGVPLPSVDTSEGRTDQWGFFYSGNLPLGSRTVTVSAPGYKPASATVAVLDGKVTRVNFVLEPAPPPLPKYTLTISYSGTGSGATSPAAGSYQADMGSTLGVTASASPGSLFDHWEKDGEVRAENPINVTMSANVNLVAFFRALPPTQFKLDIRSIGPGTTDPAPGIHLYNSGEVVSVMAIVTPGMNSFFDHWELDGERYTQVTITVDMLADHLLTAFFGQTPKWTLSISVAGQGATNPVPGDHQYDDGSQVSAQAIPFEGWEFNYWSLDNEPVATNPLPITMRSNVNLVANFKESVTPVPVTIGLALDPTRSRSMETVNFSGTSTGIESGGILAIEVLGTDEAWHQVATASVGSDGSFSVSWQVPWDSWGRVGCETWRLRATRNVTNSNEVGLTIYRDTRIRDLSAPEHADVDEEVTVAGYLEQFEEHWIPLQGRVVILIDDVDVGTANTDGSGKFAFKCRVGSSGSHTIKARYLEEALGLLVNPVESLLGLASAALALSPVIFASVIVLVSEMGRR